MLYKPTELSTPVLITLFMIMSIACNSTTQKPVRLNAPMKKLEKNEEVKVVILGAGLSGLWAAQTLRESGFRGDITILEASNSCGGRLRPHGTEKDLPMGAQWFHGREGNCIYDCGMPVLSVGSSWRGATP